jgi:type III pantothenate kinase
MDKLLAIDIGNTTISFGIFNSNKLIISFKIPTVKQSLYKEGIKDAFCRAKVSYQDISKIIICSVVPDASLELKKVLNQLFKVKALEVTKDIKIPIINKYRFPKQVGQDRLVNAYAGLKLYGKGLILVDFGTAITFDLVSRKGEYLGGLIFPGLDLCVYALNTRTALLPEIKIKNPQGLIGRDTVSSMNIGIVSGIAGACDVIIKRLQNKFKGFKVIATGGNAEFIKKYSKHIKLIRPHLALEGLQILSVC